MELTPALMGPALALSAAFNCYSFYKTRLKKPAKTESYDARALMHDLTVGGVALVEVRRVATNEVFLRSPRDMG